MFHNDMQTKMVLPTISRQTRIASSSCTLIDKMFVNNLNNLKSGIPIIDTKDHFPIFKKNMITLFQLINCHLNKSDMDLLMNLILIFFIKNLV